MEIVYLKAVVTIAASSYNDANEGCSINPQQPPSLRLSLPVLHARSNIGQRILKDTLRSTYASPFAVADSPLNKRGWVFQEITLSSRILHFTKEQVYWQCREVAESEDGTMLKPGTNQSLSMNFEVMSYSRLLLTPNLIPKGDLSSLRWSWATDYSSRAITTLEDRLCACAGIIKFFQQIPNSPAIVLDLSRERLLTDLHWKFERMVKMHSRVMPK